MRPGIRLLYVVLIILVLGVMAFGTNLAWFVTDWLWFHVVDLPDVFWTVVSTRVGLGIVAFLGSLLFLFGNAWFAARGAPTGPTRGPRLPQGESSPVGRVLAGFSFNRVLLVGAAGLSVLFALVASSAWESTLLFLNGTDFGYVDPILGRDAGFYVFTLPFLQGLRIFAFAEGAVAVVVTLGIYLFRGALQIDFVEVQRGQYMVRGFRIAPGARRHVAGLAVLLAGLMAAGSMLRRYDRLYAFDRGDLLTGPGYADVMATLPLLGIEALATLAGGALIAWGIVGMRRGPAIAGAVLAGVSWLLTAIVPGLVQRLVVEPNELAKEGEYLMHHVEATRLAFGLDQVEERDLSGDNELDASDIEKNRLTIESVRLWDHEPLLETFGHLQEIRTYYDFLSVDNDRYVIDGELRQTMLSPRELVPSSLPSQARTFVNETMTYTHGYGVAVGPVNRVTPEGLPELWVKDLPPKVEFEGALSIDRPEIYYGEARGGPVFVNTKNKEFDYPSGDENKFTVYGGSGGVTMGNMLVRALVAARMGNAQVLLSSDLTSESKVLLYREIEDRVSRVAPFLRLDSDPYMVIDQGRLHWVMDAYTTSGHFPYARLGGLRVNYMRNSVKVVVDAYDGSLTFYRMKVDDPIAEAWAAAFPTLFTPESEIPEGLRAHLRYPQDFFNVQAHLFGTFHMQEQQIFYNREDEWEVPSFTGKMMEPYYTIMTLPDEDTEEFILMLPFTPRNKPNLSAWMVARSDGEHYGKLRVYAFPKEKMVYGPKMIVARFNQNDAISEKLSLWNQQGSQVELGTLLVIPIEESLLYIQPLYLKAESGSIPELKRVIVGYENDIAMEPTLEAGLAKIFGAVQIEAKPGSQAELRQTPLDETFAAKVSRAAALFESASSAAREGDWAGYGEQTEALGELLEELKGLSPRAPSQDREDSEVAPEDSPDGEPPE